MKLDKLGIGQIFGPHGVLIGCTLFEILELQVSAELWQRFLCNFILICGYSYASWKLKVHAWDGWIVVGLGLGAWVLDVIFSQTIAVEVVFWCLFHGFIAWIATKRVLRLPGIEAREVIDAVAVFLLIGIAFANLYLLSVVVKPGSLVLSSGGSRVIEFGQFVYFSFMTQLTVGYGDIVPVSKWARTITIFQAIFGVFYVAVLVSRLVAVAAPYRVGSDDKFS